MNGYKMSNEALLSTLQTKSQGVESGEPGAGDYGGHGGSLK